MTAISQKQQSMQQRWRQLQLALIAAFPCE
jgi:hypothetical protein